MRQLFRVFIPASIVALAISEIALIFLCYVAGSWMVSQFVNPNLVLGTFLLYEGGLVQITLVVICLALGLYFQDLYSNVRVKSISLLLQQVCLMIGLAFLVSAGLGGHHAGVEQHWWPGPTACTGGSESLDLSQLSNLNAVKVIPCDIVQWRDPVLRLSLAGYNALVSLAIVALLLVALVDQGRRGRSAVAA